jgi:hypothetical protein
MKSNPDEIDWNRLLNIPHGSLATKLVEKPVRLADYLIRLQPHLYANCGTTTAKTGYRLYGFYWTKSDVEAQLLVRAHHAPARCAPLALEELPRVDWCPKPIRSWMYRDVSAAAHSATFSSSMRGFLCKYLRVGPLLVHYLAKRKTPKELPFAIEILMRGRGAPHR